MKTSYSPPITTSRANTRSNTTSFNNLKSTIAPTPSKTSPNNSTQNSNNDKPSETAIDKVTANFHIIYEEQVDETLYYKTQGLGHCCFQAILSAMVVDITANNSKASTAHLNRLMDSDSMEQWIDRIISYKVPYRSLQLELPDHQTDYQTWLNILLQ
jgi:hypothetical protein